MTIPNIVVPQINTVAPPPPTRGMVPPTRLTPPVVVPPGYPEPAIEMPIPPVETPNPGDPKGGESEEMTEEETQEEETEEREMPETLTPEVPVPEIPMAPFDASTSVEVTIPIIEQTYDIPVPKPEVVITAGTTAAVATIGATGAAVFAKPLFDYVLKIVKPIVKKVIQKILKKKEKTYPEVTPLQLESQFLFGERHLGPVLLRQHRDQSKEKKGSGKPPSQSTQHTSKP